MSMLFFFLVGYFILLFIYFIVLLALLLFSTKDNPAHDIKGDYPFISVLVAARNEEHTITSCLEALSKLDWPADKLEVLIGNDQSTDQTEIVIRTFIKDKPNFQCISIDSNVGIAKGKANVLAILAQQAKGVFYFITDADISVPSKWIQSLLSNYTPEIGIVSGATKTEGSTLFHYCQKLDWVYAFGMVKTVSDLGIPVSAVGNNMMISKEAYWSTGGYEKIPFSVTEDLQLFLETLKKGWKYKNLLSTDCIATSKPIETLPLLLAQRKRWMNGAVRLPFILLLCLFLQALFLPVLITTLYFYPIYGLMAWGIKIALQQITIFATFHKIGERYSILKGTLLFEVYAGILSVLMLVNYLLPTKVIWKGRKY